MKLPSFPSETIKAIDLKSFGIGLAAVAVLYLMILSLIFISGKSTVEALEKQMASISAPVTITSEMTEDNHHADSHGETHHKTTEQTDIIDGLWEETDAGTLPIVRANDGLTSFRAYQSKFDFAAAEQKPVAVFILKDFGLSAENSRTALEILPPEVAFILSPYSTMPEEWIKLAIEAGHEVWMHTPIENQSLAHNDSGPATMLVRASYPQKLSALHWAMSRGLGYVGVAAHSDAAILENKSDFSKISDEIYERGLGYLELNPYANSFIESKALASDAPYLKADMEILRMIGTNSFEEFESILKSNNLGIAVIPSTPNQIKNLAAWILKVGQADYAIAPPSALYDLRLNRTAVSNQKHSDAMTETHETEQAEGHANEEHDEDHLAPAHKTEDEQHHSDDHAPPHNDHHGE